MAKKTKYQYHKVVFMRFLRVFIASLIPLLPLIPTSINDVFGYLKAFLYACIIASLTALDKAIRDYPKDDNLIS